MKLIFNHLLCVFSLVLVLWFWIFITPKFVVLSNKAKKIQKNSLLRYRLEQIFSGHGIENYELYYWDTSRSKESNAMVSGVRKYHVFVSSTLIEEVTLPELEAIVLH